MQKPKKLNKTSVNTIFSSIKKKTCMVKWLLDMGYYKIQVKQSELSNQIQ